LSLWTYTFENCTIKPISDGENKSSPKNMTGKEADSSKKYMFEEVEIQ